jgi:O-antigen/teichoic acid export membrane protein
MVQAASLFTFSKWLLLNNLFGFAKERMVDFIIGRLSGPAALGVYSISYEFSHLPTSEIGAPINRALLPGFAKLTEPGAVQKTYAQYISLLAIIAFPAAVGITAIAPFMVPVVLGKKWIEGVPLMEVLAISGALLTFQGSVCALLIARGRPSTVTWLNGLFVAVLAVCMAVLAPKLGSIGAAYATLATTTLTTPLYLLQVKKYLNLRLRVFLLAIVRPVIASIGMLLIVRTVLPANSSTIGELETAAWLLSGVVVGAVAYVVILVALWHGAGRPMSGERIVFDAAAAKYRQWFCGSNA